MDLQGLTARSYGLLHTGLGPEGVPAHLGPSVALGKGAGVQGKKWCVHYKSGTSVLGAPDARRAHMGPIRALGELLAAVRLAELAHIWISKCAHGDWGD